MIVKGIVQCPHCAISIQAYFQRTANSLLCPNCQEEVDVQLVMHAQAISLASTNKRSILAWFCMQWLRSMHILRRERPGIAR